MRIEASLNGAAMRSVSGEALTAPRVDSVNTFDMPGTVAPRPLPAALQSGGLVVTLEPRSVNVLVLQP